MPEDQQTLVHHLLAQQEVAPLVLLSWWKPILYIIPIVLWAWIVSSVYDKHAARFFLPRRQWNLFHLCCGTAAFLGGLLLGFVVTGEPAFWVSLAFVVVVLSVSIIAYAVAANRDDRVPEQYHISLNMSKFFEKDEKKERAKEQAKAEYTLTSPDKSRFAVPDPESPEFEVRVQAEKLFSELLRRRASQLDIGPAGKDKTYAASVLVDGVRSVVEQMPAPQAGKIMDLYRGVAKLDIQDRRRKQSAEIRVAKETMSWKVRVTSSGVTGGGMRTTLLLNPTDAVTRAPGELGLLESQLGTLRELVQEGTGVVLLSGKGEKVGRTTTMYAIMKMHDAYTSNVQTIEIEPQASLEGIRTNVWNPASADQNAAEFSTTVRSILRRDPDVVAVAELPDAATAQEIVKSDHERTRIYVSFPASDALHSVQKYVHAVGDARKAAESLHGVVSQRLVRRLCTNCRVAYPPAPELLKKLGFSDEKIKEGVVQQLFKKGGQVLIKNKPAVCPVCDGVGYTGQTALFEIFRIGPEERELITATNFQGLRAAFKKQNLPSIKQVGVKYIVDGTTSIEELLRVTGDGAEQKKPAQPTPTQQPA